MVLEKQNFVIKYDDELSYINDAIDYLEMNMKNIMNFFEINSFSNKINIIVWNNLEAYKKHIEKFFEYHDYMRADTNDGNINLLSIEEAHKTHTHADMTIDELKSTILHEFVHICQQQVQLEKNNNDIVWFWEALATNLGNPEKFSKTRIKASNEEINNFNSLQNNYPIAFTIGNYMLENYAHEEILEYIKYPTKLLNDENKILNESREWSNNILTI